MDVTDDCVLEHSSKIRPFPGESVSGDSIIVNRVDTGLLIAIVDVLGHGPQAHQLTLTIEAYLSRFASNDVASLLTNMHQHLMGTRGAAVGLCAINSTTGNACYVGIGNTVIRRFGQSETRLVSQDGVVGQNMRTPILQEMTLVDGDVLLLYTDGISDRFSLEDYPGLLRHSPDAIAANIVQRYGKNHDDAGCIAIRYAS